MALIRGDLDIEEVKLKNAFGAHDIRLATAEEIATWSQGAAKGFIGPWKFPSSIAMVADTSVVSLRNFVLAYNQRDMHWVGANWGVELPLPAKVADIRLARVGDGCPECFETDGGVLAMTRGIEVGNIFNLGIKYSEAMRATYTSEQGEETPFIMGCYGIGVSRTAAAAIERFHDKDGMVWPMALAPYQAIVVPVNPGDATQWALAGQVYTCLHEAGVDVLLDDRDERAGVKFKDADLMGFPIRITVGKRAAEGVLELKLRDSKETQDVHHADILATVQQLIATWRPFAMAATSQVPA
jgi:prolyl-tRNA synthetase